MKKQISIKSLVCVILVLSIAICMSAAAFALAENDSIAPMSGGMMITESAFTLSNTKFSADTIKLFQDYYNIEHDDYTLEFECRPFVEGAQSFTPPIFIWKKATKNTLVTNLYSAYVEFEDDLDGNDITIGCHTKGLNSSTSYYAGWTLTPSGTSDIASIYSANFECEFGLFAIIDSFPIFNSTLVYGAQFNRVYFWQDK